MATKNLTDGAHAISYAAFLAAAIAKNDSAKQVQNLEITTQISAVHFQKQHFLAQTRKDHRMMLNLKNLLPTLLVCGWSIAPSLGSAGDNNVPPQQQGSKEHFQKTENLSEFNNEALLNRGGALYQKKEFNKSAEVLFELLTRDPLNRMALRGFVLSCQQDQHRCGSVFDEGQPTPPTELCKQAFNDLTQMISRPDDLVVVAFDKPWWFGGFDRRLHMAAPGIISHFSTAFLSFYKEPRHSDAARIIALSVLMNCIMPEYGKRKDPKSAWIRDNYEKIFPRSARRAVEIFARNLLAQQGTTQRAESFKQGR